ncbi:hypothetical protein [Borrelia hermsii]|nr:hypothetical protein [Borrelia hermsii]UPA08675.1 hypothetical protein bhDAH_001402 [Borrelia hermsii DAH]
MAAKANGAEGAQTAVVSASIGAVSGVDIFFKLLLNLVMLLITIFRLI